MKPDELLTCPFCGRRPEYHCEYYDDGPPNIWVECKCCDYGLTPEQWNTRSQPPTPAEVDEPNNPYHCPNCDSPICHGDLCKKPTPPNVDEIAEKCVDDLSINRADGWTKNNVAIVKSAILSATAHLQSKVVELGGERDSLKESCDSGWTANNLHVEQLRSTIKKNEALKIAIEALTECLNEEQNWKSKAKITLNEFQQELATLKQQLAEAGKDRERLERCFYPMGEFQIVHHNQNGSFVVKNRIQFDAVTTTIAKETKE